MKLRSLFCSKPFQQICPAAKTQLLPSTFDAEMRIAKAQRKTEREMENFIIIKAQEKGWVFFGPRGYICIITTPFIPPAPQLLAPLDAAAAADATSSSLLTHIKSQ